MKAPSQLHSTWPFSRSRITHPALFESAKANRTLETRARWRQSPWLFRPGEEGVELRLDIFEGGIGGQDGDGRMCAGGHCAEGTEAKVK